MRHIQWNCLILKGSRHMILLVPMFQIHWTLGLSMIQVWSLKSWLGRATYMLKEWTNKWNVFFCLTRINSSCGQNLPKIPYTTRPLTQPSLSVLGFLASVVSTGCNTHSSSSSGQVVQVEWTDMGKGTPTSSKGWHKHEKVCRPLKKSSLVSHPRI